MKTSTILKIYLLAAWIIGSHTTSGVGLLSATKVLVTAIMLGCAAGTADSVAFVPCSGSQYRCRSIACGSTHYPVCPISLHSECNGSESHHDGLLDGMYKYGSPHPADHRMQFSDTPRLFVPCETDRAEPEANGKGNGIRVMCGIVSWNETNLLGDYCIRAKQAVCGSAAYGMAFEIGRKIAQGLRNPFGGVKSAAY